MRSAGQDVTAREKVIGSAPFPRGPDTPHAAGPQAGPRGEAPASVRRQGRGNWARAFPVVPQGRMGEAGWAGPGLAHVSHSSGFRAQGPSYLPGTWPWSG